MSQVYAELFARAYPKAVDVLELEYLKDRKAADKAAETAGYRLLGYRQGRVVFTTKPSAAVPRDPAVDETAKDRT